jgi:hypothetical protein
VPSWFLECWYLYLVSPSLRYAAQFIPSCDIQYPGFGRYAFLVAVVHKDLLLTTRTRNPLSSSVAFTTTASSWTKLKGVGTNGTWRSCDFAFAPSHLVFIRSSARVNYFTHPLHSLRVSAGPLVQSQLPLPSSLGIPELLFIRLSRSLLCPYHEEPHSLRRRRLHIACPVNACGSCPTAFAASCAAWCAPPYPHSR